MGWDYFWGKFLQITYHEFFKSSIWIKNAPSDKISPHCVPKCISLRKNLEILSQLLSKTFQNFTKKIIKIIENFMLK